MLDKIKALWARLNTWLKGEEAIVVADWEKIHAEADAILAKYKK